jgi:hypothetical protein
MGCLKSCEAITSFVEIDSGNNQTLLMHINELHPHFPHVLTSLGEIQYIKINSDS